MSDMTDPSARESRTCIHCLSRLIRVRESYGDTREVFEADGISEHTLMACLERREAQKAREEERPKADGNADHSSQSAIGGVVLTVAEVRELTQRERWPGQVKALEALGIPYSKRPAQDGKVSLLVLREHAVERLRALAVSGAC